jgi:hypothetical protein
MSARNTVRTSHCHLLGRLNQELGPESAVTLNVLLHLPEYLWYLLKVISCPLLFRNSMRCSRDIPGFCAAMAF